MDELKQIKEIKKELGELNDLLCKVADNITRIKELAK